ncbi:tyrosine-type recombinase/integrase [Candidatus Marinimicrobia bacterium]|nr:tyrosine-type recombinase/integrase [Candidatus Neomarinimicrobiota bacterium]|tara:strand:+ start:201 stop:1283 length:1083 start_codon:yes stop_codon:yes gene_type:complete
MSNIYQNMSGQVRYNYSIKAVIGKHTLRSTLGTKLKTKAIRIQHRVNELEIEARLNPQNINDYVARFWILMGKEENNRAAEEKVNPKVLDLYIECYNGKLRDDEITQRTHSMYIDFHKNLERLFELQGYPNLRLLSFNQKVLDDLMQYFADQEYSPTTKNMRLRLLKCFFNWAVGRKYLAEMPFKISKVKEPFKKPSFLYPEDFQTILDHTTPLMRAYLYVYRATGLRRAEMFNWEEVERSNGTWLIVKGKGNKERVVAIPTDMLDNWKIVKANPVKAHSVTRAFKRACDAAGIKARLHDLRHTFAFTQVASGIDPFTLQMKMGHSDFKTTQVYLRTDRDMLMDLIDDQEKLLDDNRGIA